MRACHGARGLAAPGFTLVEVLIASTVLVVGLFGILSMAMHSLRSAGLPEQVQAAVLAGQERLDYFRAQPNPYKAVGGTYYPPPANPRLGKDYNLKPDGNGVNVVFNGGPSLFVREYLYGLNEKRYADDAGRTSQDARSAKLNAAQATALENYALNVGDYGPNVIPPTPVVAKFSAAKDIGLSGVVPNPDNLALPSNDFYRGGGLVVTGSDGKEFTFIYAPRANDAIRNTGTTLPDSIRLVREVWIQTQNPQYSAGDMMVPGDKDTYTAGTLNSDFGGIGSYMPIANVYGTLPPYVVKVTVRVYPRDPRTKIINLGDPGADARLAPGNAGPGYDRRKPPLSEVVGYFGLNRNP